MKMMNELLNAIKEEKLAEARNIFSQVPKKEFIDFFCDGGKLVRNSAIFLRLKLMLDHDVMDAKDMADVLMSSYPTLKKVDKQKLFEEFVEKFEEYKEKARITPQKIGKKIGGDVKKAAWLSQVQGSESAPSPEIEPPKPAAKSSEEKVPAFLQGDTSFFGEVSSSGEPAEISPESSNLDELKAKVEEMISQMKELIGLGYYIAAKNTPQDKVQNLPTYIEQAYKYFKK